MNMMTDLAPRVALRNLCVLDYGNGFTLWHYRSQSLMADLLCPKFWDGARDMVGIGDHILISARDGGGSLYVTADGVLVMSMATAACHV